MEEIRLSVRELVAYTAFPPDITPFSPSLLSQGRDAHLARQGKSEARRERPLVWRGKARGLRFLVSGRIDLYDGEHSPPLVEEIKLCTGEAPQQPAPEHLLQALCYGHMLAQAEGIGRFQIRVSYADLEGELRACFDEVYEAATLAAQFHAMLDRCAAWLARLERHRARRDQSLAALRFPYEDYRPGQRELAAQVFTAIRRKKRLLAMMPTGTGKSAAVLYPALKALGMGLSSQVFCLTARGTAREAMEKELKRMRGQGLRLKSLSLYAREKLCPMEEVRCDPEHCPRARGHFLRQQQALPVAMRQPCWDLPAIRRVAERFQLCPFEYSLSLSTLADVVICDYNFAFDPRVKLQRVFDRPHRACVLVDEAHNLPDRAREMLSGSLPGEQLVLYRRELHRLQGRRGAAYRLVSALLKAMQQEEDAALLTAVQGPLQRLLALWLEGWQFRPPFRLIQELLGFQDAMKRRAEEEEAYRLIRSGSAKQPHVRLLCLDFTPFLREASARFSGFVCYSATLKPMEEMLRLLGGEAEDACFELPSPFPPEHLLTLCLKVNTRYRMREDSAPLLAEAIRRMVAGKPGKYIAFFPSYQYLELLQPLLEDLPLHVQERRMDEAARESYLARFTQDGEPLLGLCVLGGVFAEGIDLPGSRLIGVCVVGVGLPQVGPEREAIREHAQASGLNGFDLSYRYPGMHRVLQAAGRLIRSGSDRGLLLLVDDRYFQAGYRALLPRHYQPHMLGGIDEIGPLVQEFWSS